MTGCPDLPMWVVYDHPRDWPNWYVARLFIGEAPQDSMMAAKDLDQLRGMLEREGLYRLERMQGDDPVILETWL